MDSVTFIVLLGCCVWTSAGGQSVSFSMVFSGGTQLLVHAGEQTADCDEDDDRHPQYETEGFSARPSAQILSSVPLTQGPGSPHLLVCLLSGLKSPLQDVLWWVDDTVVTSEGADVWLMRSEEGGAYSAILVWEVLAADWRTRSTYWCGTIQEGQVYRQKLCSQD